MYFNDILNSPANRTIHLMAEIQNSRVLLLFKTLFGDFSYPRLTQHEIPAEMKKIINIFSEQLGHVKGLNLENFSSRSEDTLYRPSKGYNIIETWLTKRGIDFSNGDNLLLLSSIPPNREKFIEQLQDGIGLTQNWRQGKSRILEEFKKGCKDEYHFLFAD